jgi:hypothetical protein
MRTLTEILNNPEEHYPGNFDTPQRANALLTGLCQDAANEIAKLQAEVLEQCRINGMSAEREDALAAELTRLKANIALDKMAENARELGLDYEPAPVQEKNQSPYPEYDRGFSNGWDRGFAAAQPAPWVGLSEEEVEAYDDWADFQVGCGRQTLFDMVRNIEAKLKEKNT